jgi:putative ABC transport system permease protein
MILHELRNAGRRLLQRPGYSALSITVLALGLGAMLFLLGTVNGMLLEPLPFPDGDRLLAIGRQNDNGNGIGGLRSADYLRLKEELRSIDAFGLYNEVTANVSRGGGRLPVRYDGTMLSAETLTLLGVRPILGRGFSADDDRPGAPLTVLLSEQVWRNDFAADPAVVGSVIKTNGEAATVIGVLPAGFAFPFIGQVWLPRRLDPGDEWGGHSVARLAPGVALQQARAELEAVSERLGHQLQAQANDQRITVKPLKRRFVNEMTTQFVWVMFAAGVLVLLLACANVANLQLAQTLTRRRELAVRSALGAGRGRLLRELLAESLILAGIASLLGLGIAHFCGQWLLDVFVANGDAPPYYVRLGVDGRMIGFGVLAAFLTTLLAGLLPALRASRSDVQEALRDGDKGSGGGFARIARGLVVAEVALTVLLLVGAGMFIRALDGVLGFDFGTGADPAQIITGRVGLFAQQHPTDAERLRFFERVVERLRADPQVLSASVATALPGTMAGSSEAVGALGEARPAQGWPIALAGHVDAHFAETYGLTLLAGRFFDGSEAAGGPRQAVVDRRLAETLWPGREALGQTLVYNPQRDRQSESMTVIGVVEAMHLEDADDPVRPTLLLSIRQYTPQFATFAVRTRDDAQAFAPQLAAAVRAEDADTAVYWLQTQQQAIASGRIGSVVLTQIFSAVGLLALLLSAAGLYGVLAFAVEQRTREIGIRRAIGAGSRGIVLNVSRRLLWQVALGLAIGVALGLPWSALLANPLLQTRGYDGLVFGVVLAMIVMVALIASVAPLRRALRVDPIIALRQE